MTQSIRVELLMFTIKMVDGGFRSATDSSVGRGRKGEGGACENGKLLFQSGVTAEMLHYQFLNIRRRISFMKSHRSQSVRGHLTASVLLTNAVTVHVVLNPSHGSLYKAAACSKTFEIQEYIFSSYTHNMQHVWGKAETLPRP